MSHASLGDWIRHQREQRDFTQESLAEEVGCAVQTIRAFERGWRRPSRSMAERLATVLGVPPDKRATFIELARAPLAQRPAAPDATPAPAGQAAYLEVLAAEAAGRLFGPDQLEYLAQLDAELDHIRAALGWAMDADAEDGAARVELGLRAASAIERFWHARGHQAEGQRWLEQGLAAAERGGLAVAPAALAAALSSAAWLARLRGDRARALALVHRCVDLYRTLGDKVGLSDALDTLGDMAIFDGDGVAAAWFHEESLALRRGLARPELAALSLNGLGYAAVLRGYYERGADHFLESLGILRGLSDRRSTAMALHGLGTARLRQGLLDDAGAHLGEALGIFHSLGNSLDAALCIELIGELLALRVLTGGAASSPAPLEEAARLWGAAEALTEAAKFQLSPHELARRDALIGAARLRAGKAAFQARWAEGWALSEEQAVELGLAASRR